MFPLFDKKIEHRDSLIVVDVRSDGVGVSIVLAKEPHQDEESVWTYFESFPSFSGEKVETTVFGKTLRRVFRQLSTVGLPFLVKQYPTHPPREVKVIIATPFANTVSRRVKILGERPDDISTHELKKLTEESAVKSDKFLKNLKIIEKTGVRTLSGPVIKIKNQYHQIIVTVLEDFWQELNSATLEYLPKVDVAFDSFMSAYYRTLNSLPHDTSNVLMVDVGDLSTELCYTEDGIVCSNVHAPLGIRRLVDILQKETGLTLREAYHILKDNDVEPLSNLDGTKQDKVEKVIDDFAKQLAVHIKRVASKNNQPSAVFLHASPGFLPFLREILSKTSGGNDEKLPVFQTSPHHSKSDEAKDLYVLWKARFPQNS